MLVFFVIVLTFCMVGGYDMLRSVNFEINVKDISGMIYDWLISC